MATNSIGAKVLTASSVALSKPMQVHGLNTYTISSDFISWGDNHNHSISEIAADFGQRTTGVGDKVFICGDDKISVFDFGLLFTVFTAMASAQAELGARFSVFEAETSRDEVKALWVGNDLIIYSSSNNLILPIDNADMERACGGVRLECSNFCTTDRYLVDRERVEIFVVEASKRELFCRLRICDHTQKYYAKHFTAPEEAKVDTFAAWDTRSALGRIIASTDHSLPTKSIFEKYRKKGLATVVDRRDELFVHPEKRYDGMETAQDLRKFAGSLCYTDKAEAVMAVNFHAGLFVYSPCFPGDHFGGVQVDPKPNVEEFYDVSEGCERIMRFANTVINLPLTSAQFDVKVFNSVVNALLEQKLPRLSLASSLGRVVIPESILETTLDTGFGADLFCMVPVGVMGEAVICKTADGKLESIYPRGWGTDGAFYDITEVVDSVER